MIAVDILEFPISTNNNRYMHVVQDYFTKWIDAIPLPNQMAPLITTYGQPNIDQRRIFESTMFRQALEAFGVAKVKTTAYHPQCDGMVESFNHTLLWLFHSFVDHTYDWEKFPPLLLYAYQTSTHSSTGVSLFVLMYTLYGRQHFDIKVIYIPNLLNCKIL